MKAQLKSLVRAGVRRLVPIVSSRPWLVKLAARAFARFPSLKLRLRRIVSLPPPPPPPLRHLDDAQVRVLMDLQDAQRGRS